MKGLQYATVATDSHSVQVSTWKQSTEMSTDNDGLLVAGENWHYKFTIDGVVKDEGILGPVEETVHADHD